MKIKSSLTFLILCSLGALILIANKFNTYSTVKDSNQCLGSFDTFAYTPPDKNGDPKLHSYMAPQLPWTMEAPLPNLPEVPYIVFSVEATRSTDDYVEIWVRRHGEGDSYFDSESEYYQFLIYRTDAKTWTTISGQVVGSNAYVDKIFVLDDGSIWGRNVWSNSSDYFGQPLLSLFNEKLQRFEFVNSTRDLPIAWRDSDVRTNDIVFWSKVLLDPDGFFWIVPRQDTIYSFDPATQMIEQHTDISDIYTEDAVLSSSGIIYLSRKPNDLNLSMLDYEFNEGEILSINPSTDEVKIISNPSENWPSYGNLYVDHSGNLWLGAVGSWSILDNWHRIYPNTFWYFFRINYLGIYKWVEPEIILEGLDGRLFYRVAGRGMAWLDTKSMKGCWFTTEDTNIVKDKGNILWMISNRQLYKYEPVQ